MELDSFLSFEFIYTILSSYHMLLTPYMFVNEIIRRAITQKIKNKK